MGIKANGFYESYPHSDPCTCSECCPDVKYGYNPTCGICGCRLKAHGLCVECVLKPEGKSYMEVN